jgi:hypothetical protein
MAGRKKNLSGKLKTKEETTALRRWWVSLLVVGSFCAVSVGVLMSVHMDSGHTIELEWKELLLLLLGALIGNFSKVVDFWFHSKKVDD